jgi:hypothetical protein
MNGGVTIHEMESVAQDLGASDITLSSGIGNVIDFSDPGDSLGLGMLANPGKQRASQPSTYVMPGAPAAPPSGGQAQAQPQVSFGLADIGIGGIETLEPITLNMGPPQGGFGSSAPVEIEFRKAEEERAPFSPFSNTQTATGPGVALASAAPARMDPEQEKKEKIDHLNKLQRLEQKGFPVSKRYTMDNTLDEMKQEYLRLVDARNLEASLRFQRQALMSVVTGVQYLNGRFDPFDLKLDGWSESVHENVEDFDEIFEELYDKYKERGKMPPEARLVMALAGSGFMCHVSNTFLRSKMPSMDDILKQNPDLARQFATAAAQQAGPGFGNFMNMAMGGGGGGGSQPAPASGAQEPNAGAFFGSSAERMAAMAQQAQAQANMSARFTAQTQGGQPQASMPQSMASMERPTARREMSGPSGVDDILQSFEAARQAQASDDAFLPESRPATVIATDLQSMASEDLGSTAESTKGGRRRRRAAVGNTVSLNV